MLKVIALNYVNPGRREEFIALAKPLIDETRKEEGNISYCLCDYDKATGTLAIVECWRDEAALKNHMASAHFSEVVPKLHELCARDGEVRVMEVLY